MILKIEIIFIASLLEQILALEYTSTLMTQNIIHFENPYVDFNVKYIGSEGYPYMTLNVPISPYDDLHLMLYTHVYDQTPNLLTKAPLSVCQLLHDENIAANHTISQYNIPQIYNLIGRECPIEPQNIRLSPYIFPNKFQTDINIGCGVMNIESRLMKCAEDIDNNDSSRDCLTLLKTVSSVYITNENCNAKDIDSSSEESAKDDGWISSFKYMGYPFNFLNSLH